MLTRIELTNFMSHAQTVIEPAPGLTVLTGPNNCGKSAVVTALQILCHNENSTYVLRHGEKECAVKVETADGHVVEWRRKARPSYTVDGKLFDRLRGAGLPDELHAALRLPKVDAGNEADFDVHFGTQKAPVFLLGSSAANAARFFASSSDALRLVQMQRRHRKKVEDANREQSGLEAESKQLNDELERLEPVVDLDARLTVAEQQYEQVTRAVDLLARATRHEGAMCTQAAVARGHQVRLAALAALSPPPELAATEPLENLIAALTGAVEKHTLAVARVGALTELPAPPEMADVGSIQRLVERIADSDRDLTLARRRDRALQTVAAQPPLDDDAEFATLLSEMTAAAAQCDQLGLRVTALQSVLPMPTLADAGPLAEFVSRFERVSEDIWKRELAIQTAGDALAQAEGTLRQRAADSTCAACGAALDPEQVVARAAAGMGGHEHGE